MLMPKKTKYRKSQKGGKLIRGPATSGCYLAFGSVGLKAVTPGRLKARQIESARRTISRSLKRTGKMWIRVFPHIPVTSKPAEVRMGSGKGSVDYWMCRVQPGLVLFEVDGVADEDAVTALTKASMKLPFQTKIVKLV